MNEVGASFSGIVERDVGERGLYSMPRRRCDLGVDRGDVASSDFVDVSAVELVMVHDWELAENNIVAES